MHDDAIAVMRAHMAQATAQSTELARLTSTYLQELRNHGVDPYDALELTKALQHTLLTANADDEPDPE